MFDNILLPLALNGSEGAALKAVMDIASANKAEVTMLHVIETIQGASFDDFSDFYSSIEEKSQKQIKKEAEDFIGAGIACTTEVIYGNRVGEIVRFSRDRAFDLLVMQSHAVNPEERPKNWNTISYQVSLFSPASVLLVK